MSDRGISKLQKIFSGGLWAWVLICLVTPYFPNRGLIHNIFTYAPPGLLCLPLALTCIVIFIRTVRKRSNQLDFANLLVCFGSSLIILGFQFHINGPRSGAIRVLTINVEMTNRNVPGLKEEIIAKHIDLVMMQEVKGGADSPAAKIMHDFPSWHVATVGEVAILSRWPLSHIERFPMRSLPGRYVLSATVESPKPFCAMTTHWSVPQISKGFRSLTYTIESQIHDYEDSVAVFDRTNLPFIVGRDFNNPPRHGLSRKLSERLTDAFSAAGNGFGLTYSSSRPVVRIDHLYSTKEFAPVLAEVGPSFGSDHYSLYAEYDWSELN